MFLVYLVIGALQMFFDDDDDDDDKTLEKVQKKATKILPKIRHLSYSKRLRVCNLPTLH